MVRINAPDLVQRIRERYGIRGPEGIEALAPEIVPVAIVDLLEAGQAADQHWYTRGHHLVAVAGQYCALGLDNPAGSGRLAVIRRVDLLCGGQVLFGVGTTQLTTAISAASNLDRRETDYFFSTALMRHMTAAGGAWGTFDGDIYVNATIPYGLELPVVLRPGDRYAFRTQLVNTALNVNILWYETAAGEA